MYYTIYRVTNNINQKTYIGKHQTKNIDDGYTGSGKLLKKAIAKYGQENFKKEILHVFDNEKDMNSKEKELVVIGESSYNLCPGGKGGWGYCNSIDTLEKAQNRGRLGGRVGGKIGGKIHQQKMLTDIIYRKKTISNLRQYKLNGFAGKKHSNETKKKISLSNKGKQIGYKNSQYGTFWITNGTENRKSKGEIPKGFYKGRI